MKTMNCLLSRPLPNGVYECAPSRCRFLKYIGNVTFRLYRSENSVCILKIDCVSRYCDAFSYGVRSLIAGCRKQIIQQDLLYRKMLDEDGNAALLRLFYCVLNSAPQAVLQLTFLLNRTIRKQKECTTSESVLQGDVCYNDMFGNFFPRYLFSTFASDPRSCSC